MRKLMISMYVAGMYFSPWELQEAFVGYVHSMPEIGSPAVIGVPLAGSDFQRAK